MLAFFRRIISSGAAVAILGVIMIAFVVTGIGTPGADLFGGGAATGDTVAKVAGRPVSITELQNRAEAELRTAARQQPGLTMPQFLAAIGGAPALVDQTIAQAVLVRWAEKHGVVAGKRLVDGEIASIPAFQGPAGFDQGQMNQILQQQRMSYPQLRDGLRDDLLRRQLVVPLTLGARAPTGLLTPYAALLLDRRQGAVGLVSASADGLPAPMPAEVEAFYAGHLARYTLPERKVVRYAAIAPDTVKVAPPSEAEIAADYRANAATYAAGETRTVAQVVLPDAAAARAFTAKVAGGTPFAKAAADAGFAPTDTALGDLSRDALAKAASPAIADAVFKLPKGGTTAPVRTDLGYAVAHVDAVTAKPGRTLDQVRGEIAAALAKKKGEEAVGALVTRVQDALNGGGSFTDAAQRNGLAVTISPPITAEGTAPSDPAFRPDATLAALLKVVRAMLPEDPATLEAVADGRYALVGVASIVRAAPVPLAEARARVAGDVQAERARTRAKARAEAVLARANKGATLAAALAAEALPAPQAVDVSRVQLAQAGASPPPPIAALFGLVPGKTALVPGPAGGWYVAKLDRVVPGDAKLLPALAAATRSELGRSLGDEYAQAFAAAARADVKVSRNPQGIAELERRLRGGAAAGQ